MHVGKRLASPECDVDHSSRNVDPVNVAHLRRNCAGDATNSASDVEHGFLFPKDLPLVELGDNLTGCTLEQRGIAKRVERNACFLGLLHRPVEKALTESDSGFDSRRHLGRVHVRPQHFGDALTSELVLHHELREVIYSVSEKTVCRAGDGGRSHSELIYSRPYRSGILRVDEQLHESYCRRQRSRETLHENLPMRLRLDAGSKSSNRSIGYGGVTAQFSNPSFRILARSSSM